MAEDEEYSELVADLAKTLRLDDGLAEILDPQTADDGLDQFLGPQIDAEALEGRPRDDHCLGAGPSILVEISGVYNGAIYEVCSACGLAWCRFGEDDPLYWKAMRYVVAHNERHMVERLDSYPRTEGR